MTVEVGSEFPAGANSTANVVAALATPAGQTAAQSAALDIPRKLLGGLTGETAIALAIAVGLYAIPIDFFGAKRDGIVTSATGSITSGSGALTVTGATFVAGDVGKVIYIPKAGAAAAGYWGTISAFTDSTHVTVSPNAGSSVAAQSVEYGSDDSAAWTSINARITAGEITHVRHPGGTSMRNGGIVWPANGKLEGIGPGPYGSNKGSRICIFNASGAQIEVSTNKTAASNHGQRIVGVSISGYGVTGFDLRAAQECEFRNLRVYSTITDGFRLGYNWGADISILSTDGAQIGNACYNVSDDLNAGSYNNWYAGGFSNIATYGLFVDGVTCNGVTLAGMCMQSCFTAFYIRGAYHGMVLSGPYAEACSLPLRIGDLANAKLASHVKVMGGYFAPVTAAQAATFPTLWAARYANIHLDNCFAVSIEAVRLGGIDSTTTPNYWGIVWGRTRKTKVEAILGIAGTGFYPSSFTRRTGSADSTSDITYVACDNEVTNGDAVLTMKTATANVWARMKMNNTPAWVAAATGTHTPGIATIPPTLDVTKDPSQWAATTAYALGAFAYVGTAASGLNVYKVATAGTSAGSGGPTGTGTGITDGTVVWDYYGTLV